MLRSRGLSTASLIFAVIFLLMTVAAEAFLLPDTGQTKSYAPGDDGAHSSNPMSFIDNGNGTVTDNNTGLIWQKQDDRILRTWSEAGAYCEGLDLGGYSDWRLPARKELMSVVDYSAIFSMINKTYFPGTRSYYWSSTVSARDAVKNAWTVNFGSGDVEIMPKSVRSNVRCVRGMEQNSGFAALDGIVTDSKTGLMWQQQSTANFISWDNALSYCEGLSLGGYSDWRLPNIKELDSITDDSRYRPARDPVFYRFDMEGPYWSSTTVSLRPTIAWVVVTGSGWIEHMELKITNCSVRCVRGGRGDRCSATFGLQDLTLHIPIISYNNGQSFYWADMVYVPDTADFRVTNAGIITDPVPYQGCQAATLSEDLKLFVPGIRIGSSLYEAHFSHSGGAIMTVTAAAQK